MNQGFSFGHWIKQQRLALDLTQDVLAERVGCSTQMIRKLEGGERRPSRTMAQRLALGLGLSEDAHSVFVEAAVGGYAPTPPRHSVPAAGNASLAQQTNLPVQRDRLIGRERELAEVAGLLRCDEVGIVTLVGPGGTGKTRLALQLAANLLDDFADGVWFVDLAPVRDPAVVASAIASTFNLTQTFGESLLDTLRVFFREKQLLLLLDNFEQVVNAAPLLADLLTSAAHVKLLVTSRVVLHLAAEQEYVVPPLALPDLPRRGEPLLQLERLEQYGAVELFIKRAKRVKPHFAMTTRSAPAIAEICTRLDGLPLAIELAAARCKLFTPEGLLQRLDRRMELLTGGARDKEKRHQTLRGTID